MWKMSYKWLNGYATELQDKLTKTGGLLPIGSEARNLAEKLKVDHSYLVINDGTGAEVVKVVRFGNEVKITRGQDGTEPKSFPAGSCVKWEVTKSGITDTVCAKEFKCQLPKDDCECTCNCGCKK